MKALSQKILLVGLVTTLTLGINAAPASADNFSMPDTSIGGLGITSPINASAFIDSTFSLAQVDAGSGLLLGDTIQADLGMVYADVNMLMQQNGLAIDAAVLAKQAAEEAAAKRRAEEERAKREASNSASQTSVGPDGCPTGAPANTMRERAAGMNIGELCARSVSQARSASAAGAIKYTLTNLGKPYTLSPKRNSEGWYDCSSYVTRAYQSAGVGIAPPGKNAPTTHTMRAAKWAVQIPFNQKKPGDLIQPHEGHVVMALSDNLMVHTNRTGDVSHVKNMYSSAFWTAWVDPGKV